MPWPCQRVAGAASGRRQGLRERWRWWPVACSSGTRAQIERPAPSLVPLTSTAGSEAYPTFSPEGDQIAFAWNGESEDNADIYVKMIGSPEARRLTTDPATDSNPAWSPDGRQIAFVRVAKGSTTGTIHVISPLGGPDRKLSDQPVSSYPLSWSPDGRKLATGAPEGGVGMSSDLPRGIRLVDTSTGDVRSITSPTGSTYDVEPAFSPDGHHLAYASCPRSFSCRVEIVELGPDDTPKGAPRRLTRRVFWPMGLAWTRNSASVVFADHLNQRLWRVGLLGDRPPEQIAIAGFGAFWPATTSSRGPPGLRSFPRCRGHPRVRGGPSALGRCCFVRSLLGPESGTSLRTGAGWRSSPIAAARGTRSGWPRRTARTPSSSRTDWDSGKARPGGRRTAAGSPSIPSARTASGTSGRSTPTEGHCIASRRTRPTRTCRAGLTTAARSTSAPTVPALQTIWRVPAAGGPEEQVARAGGGRSREAPDGRTLFFQRASLVTSPLLAVSLAGGPERTVIDCVPRYGYAVVAAGVYHLGCGGDVRGSPLFLLNPATGRDRLLGTLEGRAVNLTVSPDGKTILYAKYAGEGSDLVLIENFR